MLYIIALFNITIVSIAYKVFIHDELVLRRETPYEFNTCYTKLKLYLMSTVLHRIKKLSSSSRLEVIS